MWVGWDGLHYVTGKFPGHVCGMLVPGHVCGMLFRCAGVKEGRSQLARTWEMSIYKAFLENVLHDAIQASEDAFTHTDTHTYCVCTRAYIDIYLHTHNYTLHIIIYTQIHMYT